jgi:hypothetical protein
LPLRLPREGQRFHRFVNDLGASRNRPDCFDIERHVIGEVISSPGAKLSSSASSTVLGFGMLTTEKVHGRF